MSVIEAVTVMLETYLEHSDTSNVSAHRSYFQAERAPSITVRNYIQRLDKYMLCSPECFVLALIYIDRVSTKSQEFAVNSLSIHRALLTGLVVAAKFFEDKFYTNSYYARVGGISTLELNRLERQFLGSLDFALYVSEEEYTSYFERLMMM
mmetsp:Transcript_29711/g.52972  ORF Transcript_29711/g.52972 Transcript_29711/m.52972 type:complete len:151 (+) Transcript_29711:148-600(+)